MASIEAAAALIVLTLVGLPRQLGGTLARRCSTLNLALWALGLTLRTRLSSHPTVLAHLTLWAVFAYYARVLTNLALRSCVPRDAIVGSHFSARRIDPLGSVFSRLSNLAWGSVFSTDA